MGVAMNKTARYFAAVKAHFTAPSPAMAAYIAGFDHRETDAEPEAQQARWDALSEDERATCQAIVNALD